MMPASGHGIRRGILETVLVLMLAARSLAGEDGVRPLGVLPAFWRNSPVMGAWAKQGQGLIVIPEYLQKTFFPYRRRPYPQEIPFADHLRACKEIIFTTQRGTTC